jgi:hypothetical protein
MVRENESSRADERPGPAIIETDAGQPQVIEPSGGRREGVLVAQLRERRVVERPHALLGLHAELEQRHSRQRHQQGGECNCGFGHLRFTIHIRER